MLHPTCHGEPIVYPELAEGNRFLLYRPFDKLRVTLGLRNYTYDLHSKSDIFLLAHGESRPV
jgi:hypothetical protein